MGRTRKKQPTQSSGVFHKVKKPKLKSFQVNEFKKVTYLKTLKLLESDEPITLNTPVQQCLTVDSDSVPKTDRPMSSSNKSRARHSNVQIVSRNRLFKDLGQNLNCWRTLNLPRVDKHEQDDLNKPSGDDVCDISGNTDIEMESDAMKMTDDVQYLIDFLNEDQESQSSKKASKIQLIATEYNKIVDDENIRSNSTMKKKPLVLTDKVSSKSARNGSKNDLVASENGLTVCKKCSFSYNKKSKEDTDNHEVYHHEFVTFSWEFDKSKWVGNGKGKQYIIKVHPNERKSWNSVKKMLDYITEITLPEDSLKNIYQSTGYLIMEDGKIFGILLVENGSKGYQVTDLEENLHSEEEHEVLATINYIWVSETRRRQQSATHLMNTFRLDYIENKYLTVENMAFNVSSSDGNKFLSTYLSTTFFYVTA